MHLWQKLRATICFRDELLHAAHDAHLPLLVAQYIAHNKAASPAARLYIGLTHALSRAFLPAANVTRTARSVPQDGRFEPPQPLYRIPCKKEDRDPELELGEVPLCEISRWGRRREEWI